jgi:hypothetical protein
MVMRKKLLSLFALFSILFLAGNISSAFSSIPAGVDFAYDKEFDQSNNNNKVWGNVQAIPPGISDPITIETWLNVESYTTDWMNISSMNQSQACCTNRLWFGINGSGKYFHVGTGADTSDSPNLLTSSNLALRMPEGTWTHVALTLSADGLNNLKIYLNGELFWEDTLTRSITTNFENRGFSIGTNTDGYHRFDGRFDNFKIWNTVLSQNQIRETRYAYGSGGVSGSPSLRAFYDFDEGGGSTVADRSGNGYNLAISNTVGTSQDTFISSTRQKAISYDNQGATTSQSGGSTTFNNGSTILTIPTTAPQRTSFNFAGWFTSPTGGTQISSGSSMPNTREATVTLYAQWIDALSPVYLSASVGSSGTSINLSYNETLSATTAASSRFTVTANGNAISVSSVATSSGTVNLTLASTVFAGQTVLLSYADPTGSNDANAIQDLAGNDAASLTSQVVTNSSTQKQNQTITFNTISDKTFGDAAFTLSASDTTTSGLAITYTVDLTTSASCQISSRTVTILRAGICTINANQLGNSNFNAASQVQRSFNIARAAQSVFSLSSTAGTFLTNLQLTTSGGTDTGTVSFTVSATGTANCSIINSESLTSTSAGNCQVVATKLGTTNYLTATDTRTVTFGRASLTLTTSVSANLKYGDTSTATYSANRSLGVSPVPNLSGTLAFETSTSTACTINTSTGVVTMIRASGTCNVRVTLANDTNFSDTSSVLVPITPAKADAISLTAENKASTYTGSASAITPTYLVSGLKFSDTVTVTYNYSGTANGGASYSLKEAKPTNAGVYSIVPSVTLTNSDSYTAPSANVTNGTLTINRATRTLNPSTYSKTSLKYGESATVTSNSTTPSSDDGTFTYVVGSGCSINSSTGAITANTYFGSCLETTTVSQGNNFESATATAVTFALSKADTLTVTTATPSALTYTGSAVAVTPTISVSGLVAGNTATGATFNFSRAPTCAQGGVCQVGDTGPGGGKVFYVSGSAINAAPGVSKGGVYLEMAPATFSKTLYKWCEGSANANATLFGAVATAIGTGAANTKIMIDNCTGGAGFEAVNLNFGGQTDWFLPSSAELQVIYSLRNSLGLGSGDAASGFLYWSSTETEFNVAASLVPWAGVGGYNKGEQSPYLPIRAFSATVSTYSASVTAPTNAGSYVITPSALVLAGGITTDYYKATVYETATLTINKAAQAAFTSYQTLSGIFGTAFNIYKFGGSGDGEETVTVTNGTATGCVLNGTVLTVATAGTCVITATKAASENHLEATSTFTVILYFFVPEPSAPVSTTPTQIAVAISNGMTINSIIGPSISGISPSSGPVGTTVTITGTGMTGVDVIKIGRRNLTSVNVIDATTVTGVIPVGAATGPIFVSNSAGSDFNPGGFTVTTP